MHVGPCMVCVAKQTLYTHCSYPKRQHQFYQWVFVTIILIIIIISSSIISIISIIVIIIIISIIIVVVVVIIIVVIVIIIQQGIQELTCSPQLSPQLQRKQINIKYCTLCNSTWWGRNTALHKERFRL